MLQQPINQGKKQKSNLSIKDKTLSLIQLKKKPEHGDC